MLRSMYSGISGMKNFQTKLDVIGNNIANVNTYGFKKGRVTFKDTMSQTISGASAATDTRGGTNSKQVGLGSTVASIDTIHTSAAMQTTGRSLDIAIDGDGYFVVSKGDQQLYTRAGNFYLDDSGTLVNSDGLKVQAYKLDAQGNLTNQYGDVAINVNAVLPATTTSTIEFSENLSSSSIVGSQYTQQIKVINSAGEAETIDVDFELTSANNWTVSSNGTQIASLDFSTSPTTITSGGVTQADIANVPWSGFVDENGVSMNISLDFSSLTQTSDPTTAIVDPDGNTEGKLESFNIGSLGEINGVYSNGEIVTLGQIAIAKFSNTSGLSSAGGNLFQETINSGTPDINVAGEGRGTLSSGALEMSNVDLSEEFTDMITAQRGFQANTKIITTSDEILQELVNLKR